MLDALTLDDKYTARDGRIYLSGVQALVRLPMLQRERDLAAGLNTAGFVSGYRGSPLSGFDQQLWRAKAELEAHHIRFQPGQNEDLAATAVWGSQQTGLHGDARYDGVFAMWYGKAPGVDRSLDALRHGASAGSARHGGVLVLAGDDHGCKSSSIPSASEWAAVHAMMPVLNPTGLQEVVEYGLLGWAMSRYSGCWITLKCLIDTMDASGSIETAPESVLPVLPPGIGPGDLGIRWPDPPLEQERRMLEQRLPAAQAFARANRLDHTVWAGGGRPRLGIVATGKSFADTIEAFDQLGVSPAMAVDLGVALYKIGMSWPLETEGARAFAGGLEELLVVEEKRGLIEGQLARALYDLPDSRRPRLAGKDAFPARGDFGAAAIAVQLGRRLVALDPANEMTKSRLAALEAEAGAVMTGTTLRRTPYYCPGCPHSISTVVPEGSRALAGIGCHYMAQWMDRSTDTYTQMGGEGASWIGQAPFVGARHVFVNLGDGTYAHSGSLAIRAAIAAGVNITYKLLYNDAVAMTGGQSAEGGFTVPQIVAQLLAEGVAAIRVVAEYPERFRPGELPRTVRLLPRARLDEVQRELREIPGVTILIYDQVCAAEKRRRRKTGAMPKPDVRVVINEAVCEGCGDCGVQSNCVAIQPVETAWGRKRQVDASACNVDLSCLKGFCPSFVTVEGGTAARPKSLAAAAIDDDLPMPVLPRLDQPYSILIAGIGGTGVVTIGALLGMAAHLERRGSALLDMIGLSQKGGQVLTHLRLAASPEDLPSPRVPRGRGDLLLGCDALVAASPETLALLSPQSGHALINSRTAMPAEFARQPDLALPDLLATVRECVGERCVGIDATGLAVAALGDGIAANIFLLGFAWQRGLVPLEQESLLRAIALNGVAVAFNRAAFIWGRRAAHDPDGTARTLGVAAPRLPATLDELVAHRTAFLTEYGGGKFAERYRALVDRARDAEARHGDGRSGLALAVAESFAKLLAAKDEYEVARLLVAPAFLAQLRASGGGRPSFHLAPPLFSRPDPATGRPRKRRFGPWMLPVLRLLARLRGLRGTRFDPFAASADRRMERALVAQYEADMGRILTELRPGTYAAAIELARLPQRIRGFGPVKESAAAAAATERQRLLALIDRSARAD